VGAATEEVAVPASIQVAVEEWIAGVVMTVVLFVEIGLLEREETPAGVHAELCRGRAARRINEARRRLLTVVRRGRAVRTAVRRVALDRGTGAERSRGCGDGHGPTTESQRRQEPEHRNQRCH